MKLSLNTLLTALLLGATASLSGCGNLAFVPPDAVGAPQAAVGILTTTVVKGHPASYFAVIFDRDGKQVVRSGYMSGAYSHVTLLPGDYEVVLSAAGGYQELSAFPRVIATIEAGKTYEFAAMRVMDGRAVRAIYKEAGKAWNE